MENPASVRAPARSETWCSALWWSIGPFVSAEQAFGVLGLLLAAEDDLQALGRRDLLVQHALHQRRDRQLDAVAAGQAHDLVDCLHRLDHLADLAHGFVQRLAAAQSQAEAAVA